MTLKTTPLWQDAVTLPKGERLTADARADVVVIGGGITGLTAAYLLAKAGASVVVLERGGIGNVDTGHTSAHVTMVLDDSLKTLVSRFGRDHARAAWEAGLVAIAQIETIVRDEAIDCDFAFVDGYRHAAPGESNQHIDELREEATLAQELGFDAEFAEVVPLVGTAGIRFEGQARIHPRKYIAGLLGAITRLGGRVYEASAVTEFVSEPRGVKANRHVVSGDFIVIATHSPLLGTRTQTEGALFQTKLALYSSYVMASTVPKQTCPDVLLWDTATPYHYYRLLPGADSDVVIYGGEDHKTGQSPSPHLCYDQLETDLGRIVSGVIVEKRWSGQVIETNDGLPFIGLQAEREFSATGYGGNGLTFGTLAAVMARDQWMNQKNPWTSLFSLSRKPGIAQAWDYVKENADYPYYKTRDLIVGPEARSLRGIGNGRGKVVQYKGEAVAASRDSQGRLLLRSANCSHMGCLVAWNDAEHTWDCPCHGSRFKPNGDVISGPAESPLPPITGGSR